MVTKKAMLTLGVLAIAGVGAASMIAGGQPEGTVKTPQSKQRFGRMLSGAATGTNKKEAGSTIINIPPTAAVHFPDAPSFDLSQLLPREQEGFEHSRSNLAWGAYFDNTPTRTCASKKSLLTMSPEQIGTYQESITQSLFTPQAAHPARGTGTVTSPLTYEPRGSSTAAIGTPAAQMPVYNPYASKKEVVTA